MNQGDFEKAVAEHVAQCYDKKVTGEYVCKKCGSEIRQTTCYVSIHSSKFDDVCVGIGKVDQKPLPYCPICEGRPNNISTCVHV